MQSRAESVASVLDVEDTDLLRRPASPDLVRSTLLVLGLLGLIRARCGPPL